jgi:hypothetical protein
MGPDRLRDLRLGIVWGVVVLLFNLHHTVTAARTLSPRARRQWCVSNLEKARFTLLCTQFYMLQ